MSRLRLFTCFAAIALLSPAAPARPATLELRDLEGRLIDPFAGKKAEASVFIFLRTDCPISNAYAPEIRRLQQKYLSHGIAFWLVFLDRDQLPATIKKHLAEYDLSCPVLRDSRHELARVAGARVTPEAAIFKSTGERFFVGRIDNRFITFGKARPAATIHDLDDALAALLAGRQAPRSTGPAIGCFIDDLR